MRRIALAAVAGAAVSSLASLHNQIFDLFPHSSRYQNRIAELKKECGAQMGKAGTYAFEQAVVFCKQDEARFEKAAGTPEKTKAELDEERIDYYVLVCLLIYQIEEIKIMKEYSDKLQQMSSELSYQQNPGLVEMMKTEADIVGYIDKMGHPASAVYDWVHQHPRQ